WSVIPCRGLVSQLFRRPALWPRLTNVGNRFGPLLGKCGQHHLWQEQEKEQYFRWGRRSTAMAKCLGGLICPLATRSVQKRSSQVEN
ncbi:hypothetical protein M5D96_003124, partial [Drosophila gunungcola]